jgi:hypothetical protein
MTDAHFIVHPEIEAKNDPATKIKAANLTWLFCVALRFFHFFKIRRENISESLQVNCSAK